MVVPHQLVLLELCDQLHVEGDVLFNDNSLPIVHVSHAEK